MARLTFFAFLVLTLIQVAWTYASTGDILYNEAAKGVLQGYPGMRPFVRAYDQTGSYRKWFFNFKPAARGVTISLAPEHGFLTMAGEELIVADVEYVWTLKYNDPRTIHIMTSPDGQSLQWDNKTGTVSLQDFAKGAAQQVWRLQRSDRSDYSRLYLQ